MKLHARAVQTARTAGVIARVFPPRFMDYEAANRVVIDPLRLDVDFVQLVVEYAVALVVPENVERTLEGLLDHAPYRHCASGLHVHVAIAYDLDLWHWKIDRYLFLFIPRLIGLRDINEYLNLYKDLNLCQGVFANAVSNSIDIFDVQMPLCLLEMKFNL